MDHPKEIQELNDLLKPRWVSGLWNVDHAERPSDPKTRSPAPLLLITRLSKTSEALERSTKMPSPPKL